MTQVSRRLARRVNKDLRARHYGYVKLQGQAYIYLLTRLSSQDSSLFANELICQHVVRLDTAVHHAELFPFCLSLLYMVRSEGPLQSWTLSCALCQWYRLQGGISTAPSMLCDSVLWLICSCCSDHFSPAAAVLTTSAMQDAKIGRGKDFDGPHFHSVVSCKSRSILVVSRVTRR